MFLEGKVNLPKHPWLDLISIVRVVLSCSIYHRHYANSVLLKQVTIPTITAHKSKLFTLHYPHIVLDSSTVGTLGSAKMYRYMYMYIYIPLCLTEI